MSSLPFLMSADLHGNLDQYRALLELAAREGAKLVLVAGDLVDAHTIDEYEATWRERLFPLLEAYVARTGPLLVTMGNHDFAAALPLLEARPDLVRVSHLSAVPVGEGLSVVGYPFTPPTPFWIKDYERWDESGVTPRGRWKADGYRSPRPATGVDAGRPPRARRFEPFVFASPTPPADETIAGELAALAAVADPARTVYLIHTPPADTPLDVHRTGAHIGSVAIRRFLEERGPYLTLHGHIHETVEQSGAFCLRLGRTLACAAGNFPRRDRVAVVGGDLCDLSTVRRRELDAAPAGA
ncbi:MAG: metallophosphoesterase [Planctomycetes bacterium]|nr:metallophosphoesterase [Planctomycetota bacterium]